jgi:peptide/nickel transport system permease protein
MIRYVIKRILLVIPVIIVAAFLVYALVDWAPGDIVDTMNTAEMSSEDIAKLRASYDLDKPLLYRYGKYMLSLVQGDLGVSYISEAPVWETYLYRLPNTLKLAVAGLVIGSISGIPLGIFSARRAGKISDNLTTIFVVIGISMPAFWLALLLLQWFSFKLAWLPAGGMTAGWRSYILPSICSGLMLMASATRQTRSSMLEVLRADYLRTARAKGVPETVVIRKHALRNALIPIITVVGTVLSISLAGSVVVEQVFSWPGVGRMAVEAVGYRDTPTILGTTILTSVLFMIIQIFVDVAYAYADPRIKSQYMTAKRKKRSAA